MEWWSYLFYASLFASEIGSLILKLMQDLWYCLWIWWSVLFFDSYQPIYGFGSSDSLRFKRADGLKDLYYIEDKEVEFKDVRKWKCDFKLCDKWPFVPCCTVIFHDGMDAGAGSTFTKGTYWNICYYSLVSNWRCSACYSGKCSSRRYCFDL